MGKKYIKKTDGQRLLDDSASISLVHGGLYAPVTEDSSGNRIMADTKSVDEFFDELISQVRKDYENI